MLLFATAFHANRSLVGDGGGNGAIAQGDLEWAKNLSRMDRVGGLAKEHVISTFQYGNCSCHSRTTGWVVTGENDSRPTILLQLGDPTTPGE